MPLCTAEAGADDLDATLAAAARCLAE